jgi:hypothetical protein
MIMCRHPLAFRAEDGDVYVSGIERGERPFKALILFPMEEKKNMKQKKLFGVPSANASAPAA